VEGLVLGWKYINERRKLIRYCIKRLRVDECLLYLRECITTPTATYNCFVHPFELRIALLRTVVEVGAA
jgi:hypothetical protein